VSFATTRPEVRAQHGVHHGGSGIRGRAGQVTQSVSEAIHVLAEQLENAEAALAGDGNEHKALDGLANAARDVVEAWGA
jgi:hypothetical protein